MQKRFALVLSMLFLPGASPAPKACDESCLLGLAGDYLDALSANDPSTAGMSPLVKATENGLPVKIGEGLWQTATGWSYRHTIADPITGEIGVYGVVTEAADKNAADKTVMVAIRLKVADRKIVEAETLVTRPGDFALYNPTMTEARPVFTAYVAPEDRSTRGELREIATSYLTGLGRGDRTAIKFHPDCNRVENGVQTTNSGARFASSCAEGIPKFVYMQTIRGLRFPVIDTRRGLAWAVLAFDMPLLTKTLTIRGKPFEINPERQHLPRTLFLFELFKIEGGRIRLIEAFMRNMPIGTGMGWSDKAK